MTVFSTFSLRLTNGRSPTRSSDRLTRLRAGKMPSPQGDRRVSHLLLLCTPDTTLYFANFFSDGFHGRRDVEPRCLAGPVPPMLFSCFPWHAKGSKGPRGPLLRPYKYALFSQCFSSPSETVAMLAWAMFTTFPLPKSPLRPDYQHICVVE